MTKKAKIQLILKILLILILVPIGIVSFAATKKSFSGKTGGYTSYYNWFGFSESPEKTWRAISSSGYDFAAIKEDIQKKAFDVLKKNDRVFCLRRGMRLYSNSYVEHQANPESDIINQIDKDRVYYFNEGDLSILPTKIRYYSTAKISSEKKGDLTDVPRINDTTFKMVYAASFYDSSSTSYKNERLQKAIWGYTNGETKNSLYNANEAYNEYIKKLEKYNKNVENLEVQKKDGAGVFSSGDYYYVGPFYIGDYFYAEGTTNSYINKYSGAGLDEPYVLAGIVDGTMKINITVPENGKLYEYEEEDSKTLNFKDDGISIYYGDGGAGAGSTGKEIDMSGTTYIKTPNTIAVKSDNTSTYPRPNSTFYIKIPLDTLNSKIGKDKISNSSITNIKFSYRQTEATGKGAYLTLKNNIQEYDLETELYSSEKTQCNRCQAIAPDPHKLFSCQGIFEFIPNRYKSYYVKRCFKRSCVTTITNY